MNRTNPIRLLKSLLPKPLRRALGEEEGSELVEVSICFLMVMCLVFCVIESCWAVYTFHYLGHASHEAARYAIVHGGSWTSNCDGSGSAGSGYGSSMCTASTSDIANYVAKRQFPGISLSASDVCVEYFSSLPSSSSTTCTASTGSTLANSPGDVVQVTITHPFTLTMPLLPSYTWNLKSTSQMVIAQ